MREKITNSFPKKFFQGSLRGLLLIVLLLFAGVGLKAQSVTLDGDNSTANIVRNMPADFTATLQFSGTPTLSGWYKITVPDNWTIVNGSINGGGTNSSFSYQNGNKTVKFQAGYTTSGTLYITNFKCIADCNAANNTGQILYEYFTGDPDGGGTRLAYKYGSTISNLETLTFASAKPTDLSININTPTTRVFQTRISSVQAAVKALKVQSLYDNTKLDVTSVRLVDAGGNPAVGMTVAMSAISGGKEYVITSTSGNIVQGTNIYVEETVKGIVCGQNMTTNYKVTAYGDGTNFCPVATTDQNSVSADITVSPVTYTNSANVGQVFPPTNISTDGYIIFTINNASTDPKALMKELFHTFTIYSGKEGAYNPVGTSAVDIKEITISGNSTPGTGASVYTGTNNSFVTKRNLNDGFIYDIDLKNFTQSGYGLALDDNGKYNTLLPGTSVYVCCRYNLKDPNTIHPSQTCSQIKDPINSLYLYGSVIYTDYCGGRPWYSQGNFGDAILQVKDATSSLTPISIRAGETAILEVNQPTTTRFYGAEISNSSSVWKRWISITLPVGLEFDNTDPTTMIQQGGSNVALSDYVVTGSTVKILAKANSTFKIKVKASNSVAPSRTEKYCQIENEFQYDTYAPLKFGCASARVPMNILIDGFPGVSVSGYSLERATFGWTNDNMTTRVTTREDAVTNGYRLDVASPYDDVIARMIGTPKEDLDFTTLTNPEITANFYYEMGSNIAKKHFNVVKSSKLILREKNNGPVITEITIPATDITTTSTLVGSVAQYNFALNVVKALTDNGINTLLTTQEFEVQLYLQGTEDMPIAIKILDYSEINIRNKNLNIPSASDEDSFEFPFSVWNYGITRNSPATVAYDEFVVGNRIIAWLQNWESGIPTPTNPYFPEYRPNKLKTWSATLEEPLDINSILIYHGWHNGGNMYDFTKTKVLTNQDHYTVTYTGGKTIVTLDVTDLNLYASSKASMYNHTIFLNTGLVCPNANSKQVNPTVTFENFGSGNQQIAGSDITTTPQLLYGSSSLFRYLYTLSSIAPTQYPTTPTEVSWDVTVTDNSTWQRWASGKHTTLDNSWLAFELPAGMSMKEVVGSNGQTYNSFTEVEPGKVWVKMGNVENAAPVTYTVTCNTTCAENVSNSIKMKYGVGAVTYPDDPWKGYVTKYDAASKGICDEQLITLNYHSAAAVMDGLLSIPATKPELCDEIPVTATFNNGALTDISNLKLVATLPLNSSYVAGSANIGGTAIPAAQVNITGSTLTINLGSTILAPGAPIALEYKIKTACGFASGNALRAQLQGKGYCGSELTPKNVSSTKLRLNGTLSTHTFTIDNITSTLQANGRVKFTGSYTLKDAASSSTDDRAIIRLPENYRMYASAVNTIGTGASERPFAQQGELMIARIPDNSLLNTPVPFEITLEPSVALTSVPCNTNFDAYFLAGIVSKVTCTSSGELCDVFELSENETKSTFQIPQPAKPSISGSSFICNPITGVVLTAASTGTAYNALAKYEWSNNGTVIGTQDNDPNYTVTSAGSYTVKVTDGCTSEASNAYAVTASTFAPTANNATVCIGGSQNITITNTGASGSVTVVSAVSSNTGLATVAVSSNVVTVTGVAKGTPTITIVLEDADGCQKTVTPTVTVNELPTVSVAANITPVCPNTDVTVTFTRTGGVSVSNAETVTYIVGSAAAQTATISAGANTATATVNVAAATTVKVTQVVEAGGCTKTYTAGTEPTANILISTSLDQPQISGNNFICTSGTVELTATTTGAAYPVGTTFLWTLPDNSKVNTSTTNTYTATTNGTYGVQAVSGTCPSAISAAKTLVAQTPPATPTITMNPTNGNICASSGTTVTLSATGSNLKWYKDGSYDNSLTSPVTVTEALAGTYTVTETTNGCESAQGTGKTVSVKALSTVTVSAPATICFNGNATVTFTRGGGVPTTNELTITYNVNSGADQTIAILAGNTDATVTLNNIIVANTVKVTQVTEATLCTKTYSAGHPTATITPGGALATPVISAANNGYICGSGSVVLTATGSYSGAATFEWTKDGATQSETSRTLTATAGGSYTVKVTDGGCTSSASTAQAVNIQTTPTTPSITGIVPSNGIICAGSGNHVTLTATGSSLTWYKDNVASALTGSSIDVNELNAGAYTVTQTINGCESSKSASTTVTVQALPAAPSLAMVPSSGVICASSGTTITLNATGGSNYRWYKDGTYTAALSGASVTINEANAGAYTVKSSTNGCESATASASVTVIVQTAPATPTITMTPAAGFICRGSGSTVDLETTGSNLKWYKNGTFDNTLTGISQTITEANAGNYRVLASSAGGCESALSAVATVSVKELPNVTLPANSQVCAGATNVTVSFSRDGSMSEDNTLTVTYNVNGGGNQTATIAINSASGNSAPMTISAATTIKVTKVVEANGCTKNYTAGSEPTTTITIGTVTAPTITGSNNGYICGSGNVTLTATGSYGAGATFVWTKPDATTTTPSTSNTLSASLVGNYTVTVTDGSCTSNASASFEVKTQALTAPALAMVPANGIICQGSSATIQLTATGTGTLKWYKDGVHNSALTATTVNIGAADAGIYTVTTTNNGCESALSTSKTVSVEALPTAPVLTLTPTDGNICSGSGTTVQISATGSNLKWYKGGVLTALTGSPVTINQTDAGTYTATASTANGCESGISNSVTVNILALPTVTVASGATSPCAKENATYTTQSGMSNYAWTISGTPGTDYEIVSGAGTNSIQLKWLTQGAKTIAVSYKNSNNCSALSADYNVTVKPLPTISVAPLTQTKNSGESNTAITFTTTSGSTVSWTNTNPEIGIAASGSTATIAATSLVNASGSDITASIVGSATLNGCVSETNATATVKVVSNINFVITPTSQNVCNGSSSTSVGFTPATGVVYSWTADQEIGQNGLSGSSATGLLSFVARNTGATAVTATFTVEPKIGSVSVGSPETFTITVNPSPAVDFTSTVSGLGKVQFTNTNAGGHSCCWNFGDGCAESFDTDPEHTFAASGTYNVRLNATSPQNCLTTVTKLLSVNALTDLTALFTVNQSTQCKSSAFEFYNNSHISTPGYSIDSYTWDFGDGSAVETTLNASHTYSSAGTYTVTLTVTETPGGTSATAVHTVVVIDVPTVSVTAPTAVCNGKLLPVNAPTIAWNGNAPVSGSWLLNGLLFDPMTMPVTYAQNGNALTYQVNTACGIATGSANITVYEAPVADFTTSVTSPGEITFSNLSTGATTYAWNFGDGNTSADENPVHTYSGSGTYLVTLTATSANGCTATTSQQITVNTTTDLDARYALNIAVQCLNTNNFEFANNTRMSTSGYTISGYSWNFGDGTTSTVTNPTHTYSTAGSYTVTLTATAQPGSVQSSVSRIVTVLGIPVITDGTAISVCEGSLLSVTSPSIDWKGNTPVNGIWLLDGNVFDPSTTPLTAAHNGKLLQYRVNYTCGVATSTGVAITVNPLPVADFSNAETGLGNIQFTNASTNADTYAWNFGDGTTNATTSPMHNYTASGLYNVSLKATNSTTGCYANTAKLLNVYTSTDLAASFTINEKTQCLAANSFAFSNSTRLTTLNHNISSYSWTFGDAGTSALANPTHTYAAAGTYTVTLTVTEAPGNTTSTTSQTVTVLGLPVITDGAAPAAIYEGGKLSVNAPTINWNGNAPVNGTWLLGGIAFDPTLTTLTTLDNGKLLQYRVNTTCGMVTSTGTTITVKTYTDLLVDFRIDENAQCLSGNKFTFTNLSRVTTQNHFISSYSWDFGDGSTSTERNPAHSYAAAGAYVVKLKVTEIPGNTIDSTSRTVRVNDKPTIVNGAAPATVCEGKKLQVNAPVINWNGNTPVAGTWLLGGTIFDINTPVTLADNGKMLQYQIATPCGTALSTGVPISVVANPIADFYTSVSGLGKITFTNASSLATTYKWNFGDGSTSTDVNPEHTYASSGTYTITLTAYNSQGCSATLSKQIIVNTSTDLEARFSINQNNQCLSGNNFVFFNSSRITTPGYSISGYSWNFGDGATSTNANPTHSYAAAGNYIVTLTVTAQPGNVQSSIQQSVTVLDKPVVTLTTPAPICSGNLLSVSVPVIDWKGNTPSQGQWILGGSIFDPTTMPLTVADNGKKLQYQVTSACGTAISAGVNVVVNPNPVADFMTEVTGIGNLKFTNTSTGATSYTWNFGNGNGTETTVDAAHAFTFAGTHLVTLTATSAAGCTSTISRPIAVSTTTDLEARFGVDQKVKCLTGNRFMFSSLSRITTANHKIASYAWDFGDSVGTSTQASPNYTYSQAGNYLVTLTVTELPGGSQSSVSELITVLDKPTITDRNAPAAVCEGAPLQVSTPIIDWKGNTPINGYWLLGGVYFNPASTILTANDNGKLLQYEVNTQCGISTSAGMPVTVSGTAVTPKYTDQNYCAGTVVPSFTLGNATGITYQWEQSGGDLIGLPFLSGNDTIPGFIAVNNGSRTLTARIEVTAYNGICKGSTQTFYIAVYPKATVSSDLKATPICSGNSFAYDIHSLSQDARYSWTRLANTDINNGTTLSGTTARIEETLTNTSANVVTVAYQIQTTNSLCSTPSFDTLCVVVKPRPVISLTNRLAEVCKGEQTANLAYTTAQSITDVLYSIKYGVEAVRAGFVDVENQPLTADSIGLQLPNGLASGDYTGTISLSSAAGCQSEQSYDFNVQVVGSTTITEQPQSLVLCNGDAFSLSVTAIGKNLRYTWYRNGQAITGATHATYSGTENGNYYVIVEGDCGSVISQTASVSANDILISAKWNDVLYVAGYNSNNVKQEFTAYQWYRVNEAGELVPIAKDATSQYYTNGSLSGKYVVEVFFANGQSKFSCPYTFTSVNAKKASFKVYPNPVERSNSFTVEVINETFDGATIEVFDVRGQLMIAQPMNEKTAKVIANLAPATYILKLTEANGSISTQKVIVK